MTIPCGCRPGDPDNGWHEKRDSRCIQAELDQWRVMMQKFQQLPTADEYWSMRFNGYEPYQLPIRSVRAL